MTDEDDDQFSRSQLSADPVSETTQRPDGERHGASGRFMSGPNRSSGVHLAGSGRKTIRREGCSGPPPRQNRAGSL